MFIVLQLCSIVASALCTPVPGFIYVGILIRIMHRSLRSSLETSELLNGIELCRGVRITRLFLPYRPRMQVVPVWCLRSGLSDRHSGPSVWRWCAWADCCLCLTSQSHTCPPPTDLRDRHTNKLVRND